MSDLVKKPVYPTAIGVFDRLKNASQLSGEEKFREASVILKSVYTDACDFYEKYYRKAYINQPLYTESMVLILNKLEEMENTIKEITKCQTK